MKKIKILGLVVVFVLPLLFFSTIRTEGASEISVVIIQCGGNPLAVNQVDIFDSFSISPTDPDYVECTFGSTDSLCNKGDSCAECLAACVDETKAAGGVNEVAGVAVSGSSTKTTVTYTLFEDDST